MTGTRNKQRRLTNKTKETNIQFYFLIVKKLNGWFLLFNENKFVQLTQVFNNI